MALARRLTLVGLCIAAYGQATTRTSESGGTSLLSSHSLGSTRPSGPLGGPGDGSGGDGGGADTLVKCVTKKCMAVLASTQCFFRRECLQAVQCLQNCATDTTGGAAGCATECLSLLPASEASTIETMFECALAQECISATGSAATGTCANPGEKCCAEQAACSRDTTCATWRSCAVTGRCSPYDAGCLSRCEKTASTTPSRPTFDLAFCSMRERVELWASSDGSSDDGSSADGSASQSKRSHSGTIAIGVLCGLIGLGALVVAIRRLKRSRGARASPGAIEIPSWDADADADAALEELNEDEVEVSLFSDDDDDDDDDDDAREEIGGGADSDVGGVEKTSNESRERTSSLSGVADATTVDDGDIRILSTVSVPATAEDDEGKEIV